MPFRKSTSTTAPISFGQFVNEKEKKEQDAINQAWIARNEATLAPKPEEVAAEKLVSATDKLPYIPLLTSPKIPFVSSALNEGKQQLVQGALGLGKAIAGTVEQQFQADKAIGGRGASFQFDPTAQKQYMESLQEPSEAAFKAFDKPLAVSQSIQSEYAKQWQPQTLPGRVTKGAITSLPTTAAAIASGGTFAPYVFGGSATGQGYLQASSEGAPQEKALLAGLATGALETATEAIPISAALSVIGGRGTASSVAKAAVSEFGGEFVSEFLNPAVEEIYKEGAMDEAYKQNLSKTIARSTEAGLTGALSALLLTGASLGLSTDEVIDNPTPENVEKFKAKVQQRVGAKADPNIPTAQEFEPLMESPFEQELKPLPRAQERINATLSPLLQDTDTNIPTPTQNATMGATQSDSGITETKVNEIVNSATPETAQQALAQIEAIEAEAKKSGLPMNLQIFSQAKDTLTSLMFETKRSMSEIEGEQKELSFPKGRVTNLIDETKQIVDENPFVYNSVTNEATLGKADELIVKYPEASKRIITNPGAYNNVIESAIGMKVIEDMYNKALTNEALYDEVFELTEVHSLKLKSAGQIIQVALTWAKTTPEGMVKYVEKLEEDFKKRGIKVNFTKEFKMQVYQDMLDIKKMSDVQTGTQLIKDLHERLSGKKLGNRTAQQLNFKDVEQLQTLATEQVMQTILAQEDPSIWQKVSTFQAISHLLNSKTALRNFLSNASTNDVERMSNILGLPVDYILSLKTGKRSLAMPTKKKEIRKAGVERAKEASLRVELGLPIGDNKYQIGQTFRPSASNQLERTLSKAEKALRYELQVADEWQKGQIVEDIEDQFRRLNNGKKLTKEQKEIAEYEAKFRTFQDDTLPSKVLTDFKDTLNRVGFGKQRKGTTVDVFGKQMLGVREFGLGDLILKYSKVPGNIISRKIEYTPLGYIKALVNFSRAEGNLQAQRSAAMAFGRATTGSMTIAMGTLLRSLGLVIREEDEDKAGKKGLLKSAGLGNYKFNLTGAQRFLSGRDPSLQKGDKLITYGWIEPIGSSISIGAAIHDSLKDQGTAPEVVMDALNQTLEESLDISTLSMIKSMTYRQDPIDVAIIPFAQNVSGFVPSPLRQVANIVDPVMRQKYTGTPLERAAKQTVGTIPFASKALEPYLDPVGQERTSNIGIVGRAISQLSPTSITQYNPSPILEPLIELETYTKDGALGEVPWPSAKAPSNLTINGKVTDLTDKQKTEYMKAKGQYTEKEYLKLLEGKSPQNMYGWEVEQLIKDLEKVKSKSVEIGKKALGDK